jgi:uncharacterized protein YndB with AHSA1/START domain
MLIQSSVEIKAPPEKIWPLLVEPNEIMRWFTSIQDFKYTNRRRDGTGTTFYYAEKSGLSTMKFTCKVTQWEKGKRFGFTMISGPMKKNDQIWYIKATPTGCTFTAMLDMEMPWWIIGKLLEILFVKRTIQKRVKEVLINLRRVAEV